MAGDAIEVVLVALVAAPHSAAKPQAGLDCARADEVIALTGESLNSLISGFMPEAERIRANI